MLFIAEGLESLAEDSVPKDIFFRCSIQNDVAVTADLCIWYRTVACRSRDTVPKVATFNCEILYDGTETGLMILQ